MRGIEFVVDTKGKRKAVVINLRTHGELWEDVYDVFVARRRVNEPRESLEQVKRMLEKTSKRRKRA